MPNQVLTLGLREWHAVWGPVKTWADHHQDHHGNTLQFFANLTTVVGLPVLTVLVVAALAFFIADRVAAGRRRAIQRRAILLGLKTELEGTRDTASQDLAAGASGAGAVWTILPHTGVEKALVEAGWLDLSSGQIVGLHELRLRIFKANSLVYAGLMASRAAPGIQAGFFADGEDRLSRQIRDQLTSVASLCDRLLAGLAVAERVDLRQEAPPRAARVARGVLPLGSYRE